MSSIGDALQADKIISNKKKFNEDLYNNLSQSWLGKLLTGAGNVANDVGQYAYDTVEADHNNVPYGVRLAVAGATTPEDKLKTLQQYYPDASMDSDGALSFTDTKLGKKMTLDDPGLSIGDIVGRVPDIAEVAGNVAGTVGGAVLGSAGGPVGTYAGGVTGSGLGDATGRELGVATAKGLGALLTDKGTIDSRSLLDKAADFAGAGSASSAFTAIPYVGMPGLLGSFPSKAAESVAEKAIAPKIAEQLVAPIAADDIAPQIGKDVLPAVRPEQPNVIPDVSTVPDNKVVPVDKGNPLVVNGTTPVTEAAAPVAANPMPLDNSVKPPSNFDELTRQANGDVGPYTGVQEKPGLFGVADVNGSNLPSNNIKENILNTVDSNANKKAAVKDILDSSNPNVTQDPNTISDMNGQPSLTDLQQLPKRSYKGSQPVAYQEHPLFTERYKANLIKQHPRWDDQNIDFDKLATQKLMRNYLNVYLDKTFGPGTKLVHGRLGSQDFNPNIILSPKGYDVAKSKSQLSNYIEDRFGKGAVFHHGNMEAGEPYNPMVVIPEKPATNPGQVSTSRYGDCVPALVKNIYAEFGLPNNILYSKFIENGLHIKKTDLAKTGNDISGTQAGKFVDLLKKFGIDTKPIVTGFMKERPTNEQIIKSINESLDNGEKIAAVVIHKKYGGHAFLITGKNNYESVGGDQVFNYTTMSRNYNGSDYEDNKVFLNPYVANKNGIISPEYKQDSREGMSAINKNLILDDLGLTEAGSKENESGGPVGLYRVKGVNRPLADLQDDVYKHKNTKPVDLNSAELLRQDQDPRTRFWRYEREHNKENVSGDEHNPYLEHKKFSAYLDFYNPSISRKEAVSKLIGDTSAIIRRAKK